MSTQAQKKALRDQGMTYQQIADALGISHQAVAQTLSRYNANHFKIVTPSRCAYKGLREWMNENKVHVAELCRRCGYTPTTVNTTRLKKFLTGEYDIRKSYIDQILQITGLSYEQAFGEMDG